MQASSSGFAQFGFSPALMAGIREAGHEAPSRLQTLCIPPLLAGSDVVAHADSGTGKTLAFVLPLLQRLDPAVDNVQVLVLTPTDDVALHVAEVFQSCARHLPDFHVLPIYHQSTVVQLRQLRRRVQVVVGTPRRIAHHVHVGDLSLSGLRTLVLDEADVSVDSGFTDDMRGLIEGIVPRPQLVALAATLPRELRQLIADGFHAPVRLRGTEKSARVPSLRLRHWLVDGSKLNALIRLVEVEPDFDAALVFVQGRAEAEELAERLKARGYGADAVHGETSAAHRHRVSARLREGELDLVVATDAAAEGLDTRRVSHVVSYDPPCDAASHGRRLGYVDGGHGSAVLLVSPHEMGMMRSLEHATGQAIAPLELPERFR